jgi:hypothetical protein
VPDCNNVACGETNNCGQVCEYGSGCTVACLNTNAQHGNVSPTQLAYNSFETSLGSFSDQGGIVQRSATAGGVSPQDGSWMLKVQKEGSESGMARYLRNAVTQGKVEVWFYDDLTTTTALWVSVIDGTNASAYHATNNPDGQRHNVCLGYRPDGSGMPDHYFLRTDEDYTGAEQTYYNTGIPRTAGWHQAEVIVTAAGAYARLDGQSLLQISHNPSLTGFRSVWLAATDDTEPLYFDAFRVETLPSIVAREYNLMDLYVQTYGNVDYSALMPVPPNCASCSDNTGNARTPIMHLAMGRTLRYHRYCNQNELDEALVHLQDAVTSYECWGERWVSAAFAGFVALNAWLIWDALSVQLKQDVYDMVVQEADYFKESCNEGYVHCPYSSGVNDGDSKAEENAWAAFFYAVARNMFPNDAAAATWHERARRAGFHTFTHNESYGGFTTTTINTNASAVDYLLVNNHNASPNSFYTGAALQLLDSARLAYLLAGGSSPDGQLAHRFGGVLEQYFKEAIDLHDMSFVHGTTSTWDMEGAWLFPFQQGHDRTGDPVYALFERELIDYKYENAGSYLYENVGSSVSTLSCGTTALDQARRNGRVQWYWLLGSYLWHIAPTLPPAAF